MSYAVIHDDLPTHRKIMEAGGDAAWLYVAAICHCSRNLTDGRFRRNIVGQLTDRKNPARLARRLLEVGLWEEDGPEHYKVHDYLEYQRSRAQVETIRQKNAENGRRGGQAKHSAKRTASEPLDESVGDRQADGLANGEASLQLTSVVTSPPPQTVVAADGAEEDRSAERLQALAEASLVRFEATGGQIHTSRQGWLRKERNRRLTDGDWADPEPIPAPEAAPLHPVEASAVAQLGLAEQNNRKRLGENCSACDGMGNVEKGEDLWVQCSACEGTGVAA